MNTAAPEPSKGTTAAPEPSNARALPVRAFEPDVDLAVFWSATGEHRLLLPQCESCDGFIWYPRPYCPACGRIGVRWVEASGRGRIYSFTITRSSSGAWKGVVPYVLAYVELDEGPRVLTNIVDCPVDEVRVGQRVRVVFEDAIEGTAAVYRFTPR